MQTPTIEDVISYVFLWVATGRPVVMLPQDENGLFELRLVTGPTYRAPSPMDLFLMAATYISREVHHG